jgi:dTDP-4-dehydrorhamnose 3,5-epimerase
MKFTECRVSGAYVIDLDRRSDERGYFARAWCQREFEARGLNPRIVQINVSANARKGTLRGMHFQRPPAREAKVVSCTRGAIYDVVLDLRPDSPTYLCWDRAELTMTNRRMFYIPEDCAHGFQTLADDTEVLYFMSGFYSADHATGVRHDDPAFRIEWPLAVSAVSEADRNWPAYEAARDRQS